VLITVVTFDIIITARRGTATLRSTTSVMVFTSFLPRIIAWTTGGTPMVTSFLPRIIAWTMGRARFSTLVLLYVNRG
jgi:hypothetical protein